MGGQHVEWGAWRPYGAESVGPYRHGRVLCERVSALHNHAPNVSYVMTDLHAVHMHCCEKEQERMVVGGARAGCCHFSLLVVVANACPKRTLKMRSLH
jgi:hypothetical protein